MAGWECVAQYNHKYRYGKARVVAKQLCTAQRHDINGNCRLLLDALGVPESSIPVSVWCYWRMGVEPLGSESLARAFAAMQAQGGRRTARTTLRATPPSWRAYACMRVPTTTAALLLQMLRAQRKGCDGATGIWRFRSCCPTTFATIECNSGHRQHTPRWQRGYTGSGAASSSGGGRRHMRMANSGPLLAKRPSGSYAIAMTKTW